MTSVDWIGRARTHVAACRRSLGRNLGTLLSLTTLVASRPVPAASPTPEGGSPADSVVQQLRDLSLEELMEVRVGTVFAASRRQQKLTEAPAS